MYTPAASQPLIINSVPPVNWGTLYAYNATSTPNPSLSYLWDTYSPSAHKCTWSLGGSSPASGWFGTAFTEPTLADNHQTVNSVTTTYGAVYVPTSCVTTNADGTQYANCAAAAQALHVASGVLVFTNCPSN